jgi:hypothetical protein
MANHMSFSQKYRNGRKENDIYYELFFFFLNTLVDFCEDDFFLRNNVKKGVRLIFLAPKAPSIVFLMEVTMYPTAAALLVECGVTRKRRAKATAKTVTSIWIGPILRRPILPSVGVLMRKPTLTKS